MESHETSKRVFQKLLTWMQEKKSDVFVVATANSVASLPPELLRAGRIDAIFWVDLPDPIQREEIFRIHLKRIGRKADLFDKKMTEIIQACNGFTGAEIEVWLQEALQRAFSLNKAELEVEDLLETIKEITPISQLMGADIEAARTWAKDRGCKQASHAHAEVVVAQKNNGARKIQSK